MTGATVDVLDLLPAVDVAAGSVAQAQQASGALRGVDDPVEAARRWEAAGARWLHLVDLDAAFARGSNADTLADVISSVDVPVQVSGGVHDETSLQTALGTGCRRVVVASSAVGDRAWCADVISRYGDRVAVALDVRGDVLAPRGSAEVAGRLDDALAFLDEQGCARYIVTDVERDGSLTGPNLALLGRVCSRTDAPVIASGGISTLADLDDLAAMTSAGVEAAILGTALYAGVIDLAVAQRRLAAAARS